MESEKKQIRNSMLEDIFAQGKMVLDLVPYIEKQVKEAVDRLPAEDLANVYMTGCGDSFYVGDVARTAFMEYAGLAARAIEAFEFNTYESRYLKGKGLLIAVSISGQVGTTLNTLNIAKEKGFSTLGINATPGSKIYSIADSVIDIGVRVKDQGPVPQTYHYLANMVALFLTALHVGMKNGTITADVYETVKKDMLYNLEVMGDNAAALKDKVFNYTETILGKHPYVFVGAGPNLPTAEFAVAKLHEAACMGGIFQETEEWAHEQYFMTKPGVISFVIAPAGVGLDRSKAILRSMKKLGCDSVAIVNECLAAEIDANEIWAVKMADNEILSPMSLKLPLELLAWAVAEHFDTRPFDYDNPTRKSVCEETIYDGGVSAEEVARRQAK